MKSIVPTLSVAVLAALTSIAAPAADSKPAAKSGSAEFERMKSLIGTWTGRVDVGQGPVDMTATYKLIAGGSVIEERVFAGTPMEMTTMYFDNAGKIAGTHYCVMGNRPQFLFKGSDAKSITFDFDSNCGIDPKNESHMHSMKIVFKDANTLGTSCVAVVNGKEVAEHETELKRVK
jgi:hypothetical protein